MDHEGAKLVGLWISYGMVGTAAVLAYRRAGAGRARPALSAACAAAAACSAVALLSPLFVTHGPLARVLVPMWGALGIAVSALAWAFVRGHAGLRRVLRTETRVGWAGGQNVGSAPAAEGFRYRPVGLLALAVACLQLQLTLAPVWTFYRAGAGLASFTGLSLCVVAHAVVLGIAWRMCQQAFFARD